MISPVLFLLVQVIQEGSPEVRVLECVPANGDGISKTDLEAALGADTVKVRSCWALLRYSLLFFAPRVRYEMLIFYLCPTQSRIPEAACPLFLLHSALHAIPWIVGAPFCPFSAVFIACVSRSLPPAPPSLERPRNMRSSLFPFAAASTLTRPHFKNMMPSPTNLSFAHARVYDRYFCASRSPSPLVPPVQVSLVLSPAPTSSTPASFLRCSPPSTIFPRISSTKIGLGPCMKNKWLAKGEGGVLVRGANGGEGSVEDGVKELLKKVEGGETLGDQQAKDLKKRKLVTQVCGVSV